MRPANPRSALALLLLTTVPGLALAQVSDPALDPKLLAGPNSLRAAFGLGTEGERQFGGGDDYKIEFAAGGFEFIPALGRRVETNRSLRWELQEIEREGAVLLQVEAPERPEFEGNRAVWQRAQGVEERLELSQAGAELSFLFPTRPEGTGDLVVRGALETNLELPSGIGPDGSLQFREPGVGGVTVGQVFGIDANGRRIEGHTRLTTGALELVLPAEFVDSAAYPLLLDPFIGTTTVVATGFDEGDPDVAYDESTDEFLVVWERGFSSNDFDVRGARLTGSGNLTGGLVFVETSTSGVGFNPCVGNADVSGAFLCVWQEGPLFGPWDIRARAIDAGTSTGGTTVTVNTAAPTAFGCDVSDSTTDDRLLIVWTESGAGIRGRIATVEPDLDVSFGLFGGGPISISTDSGDNSAAVSKSGSLTAIWAVVWQRNVTTTTPSNRQVAARMVNFSGSLVTSTAVAGFSSRDEEFPDVDGAGGDYMVTYRRDESSSSSVGDIVTRPLTWDGGSGLSWGSSVVAHGDSNDEETRPRIAFTGDSYVVVWQDAFSNPDNEVRRVVVDRYEGQPCGSDGTVPSASGGAETRPAIVSKYRTFGLASPDVLIAFDHESSATGDPTVQAALFRTTDGVFDDLGGDCGNGGDYDASCAVAGETSKHRLRFAEPATAGFLVGSSSATPFGCGSCTLHVNPFSGFVIPTGATASDGSERFDIAIPAGLEGTQVTFQWAVLDPTPQCSTFSVDLSNALRITIQ